ncbi:TAXI family TRAP transporter solute-binding subunit [Leucothrix sargassi]|nr:TAXI family TRAP transporter solute-binding subunit [Leucothrix sargassi]
MKSKLRQLFSTLCVAAVLGGTSVAQADQNYTLATASTGGTYYPVGVALATLTKVKLQPSKKIGMSAINSAGSGENVKLLRDGEAQFAILQGLYGYYASTGTGPLEKEGPQKNVRSITMLWPNVEHFVVKTEFAKTGTISDFLALKGETVSLGKKNSGTLGSNSILLKNLGASTEDFNLIHMGYGPSADALANNKAVAMSTPAGDPVGAVTKALASDKEGLKVLSFTEEQAAKADNGMNLWTPYLIKGGTYPGIDKDFTTIAQPNFLAVDASVSEEDVYQITKTIFENLDFLGAIHKATKKMSHETALKGLPIKLHAGAIRYFEEAGVTIPDNLK